MSTIDSAILAPSSVLSNNILLRIRPHWSGLTLSRWAVLGVALFSLLFSYLGRDAYELLESAYAIGMVGLFIPLVLGVHSRRGGEKAALASMVTGVGIWGTHMILGWESLGGELLGAIYFPQELAATAAAWLVYESVGLFEGPASGTRTTIA